MGTDELYPTEADTLTAATDRFIQGGFRANFHLRDGKIISHACPTAHEPEDLIVEEVARFEGASDPDDESAIFALRCLQHGTRGTLATSYGPAADPADQDIIHRLQYSH